MSHPPPLKHELKRYNTTLDRKLRERFHVSLRTYKLIKALTQLTGAAAGIYAMTLGAPPLAALALTTLIIAGPEVLEVMINMPTDGGTPPGDG